MIYYSALCTHTVQMYYQLVQIQDVSLKIEHAHTESSELRPHNLARLHIYVVARWSPMFSRIGQQEVALKNEVVPKTSFF